MPSLPEQLKLSGLKNPCVRLINYFRERRLDRQRRSQIKMAVFSGSIRRIK